MSGSTNMLMCDLSWSICRFVCFAVVDGLIVDLSLITSNCGFESISARLCESVGGKFLISLHFDRGSIDS